MNTKPAYVNTYDRGLTMYPDTRIPGTDRYLPGTLTIEDMVTLAESNESFMQLFRSSFRDQRP